jgi:hypothetical protein
VKSGNWASFAALQQIHCCISNYHPFTHHAANGDAEPFCRQHCGNTLTYQLDLCLQIDLIDILADPAPDKHTRKSHV